MRGFRTVYYEKIHNTNLLNTTPQYRTLHKRTATNSLVAIGVAEDGTATCKTEKDIKKQDKTRLLQWELMRGFRTELLLS